VQGDPFFYDQDEHFYGALKELLQTPLRAVNHQLHQLDWPTHIKKYDTFFEDAISNH
jgi:hypothetical protein